MRRVFVSGGELELAQLLDVFPVGVEEVDGGFAVYTDDAGESALGELFEISSSSFAEGWEEAWREFHHGVVVGRFWVGPPWEQPTDGFTPVVIDPGRAFGTGAHATTRLSLDLLQELEPTSLLDVGCGSGVLSIAAAKLGFAPIIAVDNEQDAVEIADLNAHANGVSLTAYRADALVDDLPRTDVVIANVALDVVEALLPLLDARLAITSGYLERDELRAPGWHRLERRDREGWAADLFERVVS
ncbi:MAG TPA: 50S ribosomal protein L11 methyltransferase [Gaiellaceae bacterium]|nr:50S ribosomal protein L11 methyltransferase [Gaiellaceae bacterium]